MNYTKLYTEYKSFLKPQAPQPDYFSKAPKWMLWLGIIFFITGIMSPNLIPTTHTQNYGKINGLIDELIPRNIVVFMLIFFLPIIEELGFRGWQLKQYSFKVLAHIIILFYTVSVTDMNLFIAIIVNILFIMLVYYKPNRIRRILAIMFTSLVFTLGHWSNNDHIYAQVPAMINLFGLSLIINYLTWRYTIIWAFVLHFANNGLAVFLGHNNTVRTIETEQYSLTIEQYFGRDNQKLIINNHKDSIFINNKLFDITRYLYNQIHNDKMIWKYNMLTPNTELHIKLMNQSAATKKAILDTLLKTSGYKLDTISAIVYHLKIPNNADTVIQLTKSMRHISLSLTEFKHMLKRDEGIYILPDAADDNYTIISTLNDMSNIDKLKRQFESKSIQLIPDSTKIEKMLTVNQL